ncbi:Uncharacterized protein TCM_006974 [Theobroma cacao]|uniref:Uncharacterized protein n=1 Tax=Theobroma cacao TaxID=3641 RepID=A0A061E1H3_THECC|nr:Uncharacterized protein TCM_006974 [Theobroma cacao]
MRVQSFLDCGGCRGSSVSKFLRSTEGLWMKPRFWPWKGYDDIEATAFCNWGFSGGYGLGYV